MNIELETLQKNKTWELFLDQKKVLTNRWVFKTKLNSDGSINKHKARLVARGYIQRKGLDYEDVFAPVARYEIIRVLLAAVKCTFTIWTSYQHILKAI